MREYIIDFWFFYALTPLSNSQINFIFYSFLCTNCCLKFSPHPHLRLLRRTQLLPTMLAKNWPENLKKKIREIKSIFSNRKFVKLNQFFKKKSCILKSKLFRTHDSSHASNLAVRRFTLCLDIIFNLLQKNRLTRSFCHFSVKESNINQKYYKTT